MLNRTIVSVKKGNQSSIDPDQYSTLGCMQNNYMLT